MSDAFDLSTARIVNAPDVRTWAKTATITSLQFGNGQTKIEFTKRHGPNRWPDVIPPGWDGPIQFTLCLFRQINGEWVGSAFIEFWNDRVASGEPNDPDVPSLYHRNWFYGSRWAPLLGKTDADPERGAIPAGESIGFMVVSGDCRDSKGPFGPMERSNVVVIPATDNGSFAWSAEPPPEPSPEPPSPNPPEYLAAILNRIARLEAQRIADAERITALEQKPEPVVIFPTYVGSTKVPWFGGTITVRSTPEGKS